MTLPAMWHTSDLTRGNKHFVQKINKKNHWLRHGTPLTSLVIFLKGIN